MAPVVRISVQADVFDLAAEAAKLKPLADVGAVVTFTGVCRGEAGRLSALEIEHYPGMAETEIERIVDEASSRWPLAAVTVIHRYGKIPVGDDIVLVVTASAHRQAAFEAASFLMDFMKSRAPFWKREHGVAGAPTDWVAPRESDDSAAARWDAPEEASGGRRS